MGLMICVVRLDKIRMALRWFTTRQQKGKTRSVDNVHVVGVSSEEFLFLAIPTAKPEASRSQGKHDNPQSNKKEVVEEWPKVIESVDH
ncbi:hypothetical protein PGT21_020351 [Puccinia graminis f. sp. tritici]|uniref:Uncharacterized protein n=1 Tax=Puccinia graminis f. sp. tritici TaxID=56615 RepID=A0A5B0S450_PUCGR|nr:hypothetical protein PGT21_020351 [Puccinia graminis f. sp. tritici]KAA1131883.1 hypothetical protein PGTUg99_032108 [Puccinia graminis f. sp. tritici]